MEGAHEGARTHGEVVVGVAAVAASQRLEAQGGVAGEGRVGRRVAAANSEVEVAAEVERAMKQGTALVQASLEHLDEAKRSWERWLVSSGTVVETFPSEVQVVTYMAVQSRERQRMCLAQRGTMREGRQRSVVRNYVAEMGNNWWATKYPAFGALEPAVRRAYWGSIFGAYKAMYAVASAPANDEAEEARAAQLVAQTEAVYRRKHVYRTEVFQLQDLFIGEKERVHEALLGHATMAIIQSTAARVGMMTKSRHDERTPRWSKEHPLRVRDFKYAVRKLVLRNDAGARVGEATTHAQINWRRVKKLYFEVYLFRSALTANAGSAVRRTITIVSALQVRLGRFRACRKGLSGARLKAHMARLQSHGYVRLCDTEFKSWKELVDAVEADACQYNEDMLDDPLLPEVVSERVRLKTALTARQVYSILENRRERPDRSPCRCR